MTKAARSRARLGFKVPASPELMAAWALCLLEQELTGEPSRAELLRLWKALNRPENPEATVARAIARAIQP